MWQIVQLLEKYIPPDGSIYGCWQIIAGSSGLDGLKHDSLMTWDNDDNGNDDHDENEYDKTILMTTPPSTYHLH